MTHEILLSPQTVQAIKQFADAIPHDIALRIEASDEVISLARLLVYTLWGWLATRIIQR